jgi:hypothetical protein
LVATVVLECAKTLAAARDSLRGLLPSSYLADRLVPTVEELLIGHLQPHSPLTRLPETRSNFIFSGAIFLGYHSKWTSIFVNSKSAEISALWSIKTSSSE